MMNFRTIKEALVLLLGSEAAGRYRTIGYQEQGQSAEEVLGVLRSVQVFYTRGAFPKNAGSINGPTEHEITFTLDLTVSAPSEGPLSVLNDPGATPAELIAAIAAFREAADVADYYFDEFADILYQIIMDARNQDLGLPLPEVPPPDPDNRLKRIADRWIGSIDKNPPQPRGEYVILTGTMQLTCSIDEQVLGDEGIAGDEIDVSIQPNDINGQPDRTIAGVFLGG